MNKVPRGIRRSGDRQSAIAGAAARHGAPQPKPFEYGKVITEAGKPRIPEFALVRLLRCRDTLTRLR
jgi:hypothetical protein